MKNYEQAAVFIVLYGLKIWANANKNISKIQEMKDRGLQKKILTNLSRTDKRDQ
jgi:hypothetical protein